MALNREAVIRSAEKYVSKGKLEHAIKEYRKVLAENPNDANTLNRVGDLYARIERFDEAVKLFSQIAEQYTKDGFFVKAIAIYKKIIKLDPSALAVYERLAELYYKQGLLNEARTQYQVLADYYQKHDNATSAITIYQKMSQMEPENPSFHLKLAELYTSQRLIDKAMREYRQLADILIVNGSVDEATQVYEKALEVDSDDLEFVREAVAGLNDNGHVGAAAKVLAKAVELNPAAREVAKQAGLGDEDAESAAPETAAAVAPDAEDEVYEIAPDDGMVGFGDDSAYVPGDSSPFGDDTFDAPETSFGEPAVDEVSFDSTPAEETGGMASFGSSAEDDDEVFTFDIDDDEIPPTQVLPPEGLDDSPISLDDTPGLELETPDIELELDLDDGAVDLEDSFSEDSFSEDGGTEELGAPAGDDTFDLGEISLEGPGEEAAPVAAAPLEIALDDPDPGAESVEIDWSMDDLDLGLPIGGGDVQPVEVEELDLGDLGGVDFEVETEVEPAAGDETVHELPVVEPFAPEDFAFDAPGDDVGDDTVGVEPAAIEPAAIEPAAIEPAAIEPAAIEPAAIEVETFEFESSTEVAFDAPADLAEAPAGQELADQGADDGLEVVDEVPEEELPAVRREADLLAEAVVFSKYGLVDKAKDRLSDLQELRPDHPGGLQLGIRMSLEAEDAGQTLELAHRLLAIAETEEAAPIWQEVQADLTKAGFRVDGDKIVHGKEPEKKPSGDRIAQLLEDLSLEDLGAPSRASKKSSSAKDVAEIASEDQTVEISSSELSHAVEAAQTDGGEPAAPVEAAPVAPEELVAAPAPAPTDSGKKLFSLADELALDGLNDDLEDDEVEESGHATAEETAAAVDAMDETGMSWLDDVAPEAPQVAEQSETIFDEEDDFFDLAAELERELSEDELASDDGIIVQPQEQSLEEIIEGFKQGVAENLSPEDYDTHYNLGIAYREMGLVDEAIGEFQLACKDDRYMVDCCSMLGQCFLEKGLPDLAIRWYRKGLEAPEIGDDLSMGLLYEMGNAYLAQGDQDAAYRTFVEVYGLNSNYRDVAERLEELQGEAPA